MNAGCKPVVIVVVSFLVVALFYGPFAISSLLGAPKASLGTEGNCLFVEKDKKQPDGSTKKVLHEKCCWWDEGKGYCQLCTKDGGEDYDVCGDTYCWSSACARLQDLPQLETVPPIRGLPSGGDVPTLEQVPPGLQPGSDIPTLEQGPGEPTLPVVCSEEAGLEKDPETGQCVPIEPEAPEQPEEAEEPPEEEQPSEGEDSSNN